MDEYDTDYWLGEAQKNIEELQQHYLDLRDQFIELKKEFDKVRLQSINTNLLNCQISHHAENIL